MSSSPRSWCWPSAGRSRGASPPRHSSSAGTPGAPGPCSRRRCRRAWPAKEPTWSTSGCSRRRRLAWLSESRDLPAVVISASHNPFADNGIKLFAAGGLKLSSDTEAAIEEELARSSTRPPRAAAARGARRRAPDHRARAGTPMSSHLARVVQRPPARWAPTRGRLRERGGVGRGRGRLRSARRRGHRHRVRPRRHQHQRGCGSTRPRPLAAAVVDQQADLGLALDGDADRLLAVDAHRHGRRRRRAAGPLRPRPGRRGGSWPATRWWSRS